tara:strand:- start:193 stop:390 length:198 start_codon:yes stop_codon:yes gene_type:complete
MGHEADEDGKKPEGQRAQGPENTDPHIVPSFDIVKSEKVVDKLLSNDEARRHDNESPYQKELIIT